MICVVVQTVIFGFGNVIMKFAYESVTPLWCMVLRFGLALAVFALAFGLRMVRELRGAKLDDWAPTAACLAVGYIACNLALDVTTATNAGFLVALPVVFAPFIAQVVRHVRYPRAMIPFQVAVAGGLYLLCCKAARSRSARASSWWRSSVRRLSRDVMGIPKRPRALAWSGSCRSSLPTRTLNSEKTCIWNTRFFTKSCIPDTRNIIMVFPVD